MMTIWKITFVSDMATVKQKAFIIIIIIIITGVDC